MTLHKDVELRYDSSVAVPKIGKSMPKSLMNIARITFALSLAGVVAVGCGRKGDLDRPSTPVEQQNIRKSGERAKEPVPDKPFVLDPLL
ncbi:LPS translocon maturation chaperone LptM [Neorhizobium sp. DT-125]|uniref:LPS translocon maturation chaperone LptM n=1 Tax=Neorhizobium sp. DT-125 TaxID=3396163 RepID=UPI003F194075